jgi:hypothetical protein
MLVALLACNGAPPAASSAAPANPLHNAAAPLVTPTYDGSGQAMHPGILYFPDGWHGFKYWLVVTPYPNYDSTKENPSILVSNDNVAWDPPPGLINPVAPGNGNLADGDLFYDEASDQLWLYYLDKSSGARLVRKTSSDGVTWSAAESLASGTANTLVSPAVDKIGDTYYVWSVNPGPAGSSTTSSTVEYRTSTDGRNWSPPQTANISQRGYVIWHLDVVNADPQGEIWMVFAAYPVDRTSGYTKLFFAKSTDGVNWSTFDQPVLSPTASGWDNGEIYRSTLIYDSSSDGLRIWYSARQGTVWHTGYTEGNYSQLLAWLEAR